MKTFKSKLFAFAFVALGLTAGVTSCSKNKTEDCVGDECNTDNLNGTFIGKHMLEFPSNILELLSEGLPVDPETGEKPKLNEGFDDTLTVKVVDGNVILHSNLLDLDIEGKITGHNRFTIPIVRYETLDLGPSVQVKTASIKTSKDIIINSNEAGTKVNVNLILTAEQIADFKFSLTIPTNGVYTKKTE